MRKNDRFELPWDGKMEGNNPGPPSFREGVALGTETARKNARKKLIETAKGIARNRKRRGARGCNEIAPESEAKL